MAALTLRDRRLLHHPPTTKTWVCQKKRQSDGIDIDCATVMSNADDRCYMCGSHRPAAPVLLYPAYEAACKKAGIEPGDPWPPKAVPTEGAKPPTTRRKANR